MLQNRTSLNHSNSSLQLKNLSIFILLLLCLFAATSVKAVLRLDETAQAPTGLQVETISFDSAEFEWTAPTDAVYGNPISYRLFLDNEFLRQGLFTAYYIGGGFEKDVEYEFSVEAIYSAEEGKYSEDIVSSRTSVNFVMADYTVSSLRADVYSQTAAELFWDREQFNSNTVYKVYRNGELLMSSSATSYFDDSLAPGETYSFEVVIVSGNSRSSTASVEVQTPGGMDNGSAGDCSTIVTSDQGVISWPDDGLYQVQSAEDYTEICQGGRSCNVSPGIYNVINLSSAKRCENIVIDSVGEPSGGDPLAPPNNIRTAYYSSTAVELFWENTSDSVIATRVLRDGVLTGVSDGVSFYDDGREENAAHRYSLIAIDSNNQESAPVYAGGQVEQSRLADNESIEKSFVGTAVSVLGDTMIVGMPNNRYSNNPTSGAVYVYTRLNNDWILTQQLAQPEGSVDDRFGTNVKLDDDSMLIMGSGSSNIGTLRIIEKVFIYKKNSIGQWVFDQALVGTLTDGREWYDFGTSFDMDGNTLFVGSSVNDGYVFVYAKDSGGQWQQTQVLAIDFGLGVYGDLGSAVAVNGDVALIGAAGSEEKAFNAGSVFSYSRNSAGLWEQTQQFFGSQIGEFDGFGGTIVMQGDTAIIGTDKPDTCSRYGVQSGNAVHVFKRDSSNGHWSEHQRLVSSDTQGNTLENFFVGSEMFGTSIAFDGQTILIGAAGGDGLAQSSGVIYRYEPNSQGQWLESEKLLASAATPGALFGGTIGFDNDTIVAGQYCAGESGEGYVYVYPADKQ